MKQKPFRKGKMQILLSFVCGPEHKGGSLVIRVGTRLPCTFLFSRTVIYNNFIKAIYYFIDLLVTSSSRERSVSKLTIVLSFCRRLDGLLTIFVQQDNAYIIHVNNVIELFKV